MRELNFYFDLVSPFSHVALARFGELPSDIAVKPRPILLGAVLAHWGQRGPAEIEPKRIHTYRLSCFLGERYGLTMTFPPRHPFNPLAAMRILTGAGVDLERVRRAFDFVFAEGRAPDNPEEIEAFAEALGADAGLAADQAVKDRLRAETDAAIARGVFGVPTFDVEAADGSHELFWGVDSFDMLLAWLKDDGFFARAPYAGLDDVEVGVVRKAAGGKAASSGAGSA